MRKQRIGDVDAQNYDGACVLFIVARYEASLSHRVRGNGLRELGLRSAQKHTLHPLALVADDVGLPEEKRASPKSSGRRDVWARFTQISGVREIEIFSDPYLERQPIRILPRW